MCNCRPKLRGEVLRAFWDAHFAAWLDSDLNQREYCEAQGLSLRQFGNWRAELKYEEHVAARRALWRRNGRVSHMTSPKLSHMTTPRVKAPVAPMAPVTVAEGATFSLRRRLFSQKAKQEIVLETLKPGTTVSDVARRHGIAIRVLFRWRFDLGIGGEGAAPDFASIEITDNVKSAADDGDRQ